MVGRPVVDVRIEADEATFEPRDAALLRAIEEHGSINRAATALGRSYAHAQRRIDVLDAAFGAVLERTRGGPDGGGSRLTPRGRELLRDLERLRAAGERVATVERTALPGALGQHDGQFGVVETAAGRVRARTDEPGGAVTVSVPADAVTLHRPEAPPAPSETSARNRLRGRVVGIDRDQTGASVSVDVGADAPLQARITAASLARLDITSGDEIVAAFKATATRAIPE